MTRNERRLLIAVTGGMLGGASIGLGLRMIEGRNEMQQRESIVAAEQLREAQQGETIRFRGREDIRLNCQIDVPNGEKLICEFPSLKNQPLIIK